MSGKFTIQQMLWATLVFGFVAMVMTAAYRGNVVATGVLIAPLFMTITFGVLTVVYWLCYLTCRLLFPPIHTPAPAEFSTSRRSLSKEPSVSPSPPANRFAETETKTEPTGEAE